MSIEFVSQQILVPNKLQISDLSYLLGMAESFNIDYSDLYFQSRFYENWILEDKIIKSGSYHVNQGVGIRVIVGEKTGFSYTNKLVLDSLVHSMNDAIGIVNSNNFKNAMKCDNREVELLFSKREKEKNAYLNVNPLSAMSNEEKIDLLIRIDKIARHEHSYVKTVQATLSGMYEQILVAATDGTLSADIRPLIRLSILVQVEHNGRREQGFSGGGGRSGYDYFLNNIIHGESCIDHWTKNAVKMGVTNLKSISAPIGTMPVVLGPGWPGILIHEAVGHGLESDFNRKGSSVFSKEIGKKVASELCTIVDDATFKLSRGSLIIDDEGIPGQYNILIKDGVLQGYMQDKLNSKFMGVCSTGNGRRESYSDLPMPRMTNTYMLPGKSTPEEIINSIEYGVYATNFGGGQVDITSGKFVFSTSEAFLIEKGNITNSIKGATLIGSGIEIMQNISMIGNDLLLDSGIGTCVKNGQKIPVSVGQPTIKLNKITIGGVT
ncbi:putative modulator of DNA gyrase [Candidatus Blochmanniella vafra str. BVAF]|uniref:Modulator of DNA gyrase n=1 Tax=Blochmanniella vafra (strain BVAF) TaxID=859654 RepID=E8Q6V1_BLOVB|nr:metalloprotease TldD [Candidatus Blochmannia vafer]ADV33698.1 putative modulator of DNA gyrase [Candidatus Blochmannia vafer str. BVAF]